MHLLLVISSLGGGGAERVISRLAEAWLTSGVTVTVATFEGRSADFYKLPAGIARRSLNDELAGQRRWLPGPLNRIRWLRSVIREAAPDAVIAFTDRTNVLTLCAARGLGVPVIVSERVDPLMYSPGSIWVLLRRLAYPWAQAIVVQTRGIAEWSRQRFSKTRTTVIANPAPMNVPQGGRDDLLEILAVGRLTHQKGFDLLIDAFAQVADRWPEWRLRILGEGEGRPDLEKRVAVCDLHDRISLPGQQPNAIEQIAQTSIFVLSSRYEGFPNVLVEAMAAGRAVIATDCRSGPADLIHSGVNGTLVPPDDPTALANALGHLMADADERRRMGAAAMAIRDTLSMEKILSQWNSLLAECGVLVANPAVPHSRAAA